LSNQCSKHLKTYLDTKWYLLGYNQHEAASNQSLLHAGFLLGLHFSPEIGGDMFLQNAG
jgi:hypothetical protein